jgi:hypothetical protein
MIRKIVTHVPTGKSWQTQSFPCTDERQNEYGNWLIRVLNGTTSSFTLATGLNDKHFRQTMFNEELLKQCVVEVEVYEERDE